MKIYFHNFGCKLNLAETQDYQDFAGSIGYLPTNDLYRADIVLINSCHVTNAAHRKLNRFIKKISPAKKIIISGCIPKEFINLHHPQNFTVIPPNKKQQIKVILNTLYKKQSESTRAKQTHYHFRTRKFIKVQTGCNTNCSYCIIPRYRGSSKSISAAEIIRKINLLSNCQEIIITGTNLGQYHFGPDELPELIEKIIHQTTIPRVRVSSIDVTDINDRILNLYINHPDRLCPHFHLALQSASDRILQKMKRPYQFNYFKKTVEKIYNKIENVSITTDIIIGFPGEEEKDFLQTVNAVKDLTFLKAHIFPYSEHSQTIAASIHPKIEQSEIKKRCQKLISIAEQIRQKYISGYIGKKFSVLLEPYNEFCYKAFTTNYIPVLIKKNKHLSPNTIHEVIIKSYSKPYAIGDTF